MYLKNVYKAFEKLKKIIELGEDLGTPTLLFSYLGTLRELL